MVVRSWQDRGFQGSICGVLGGAGEGYGVASAIEARRALVNPLRFARWCKLLVPHIENVIPFRNFVDVEDHAVRLEHRAEIAGCGAIQEVRGSRSPSMRSCWSSINSSSSSLVNGFRAQWRTWKTHTAPDPGSA